MYTSVRKFSKHSGWSYSFIRERVQSGEIPTRKLGARLYIDTAILDKWRKDRRPVACETTGIESSGVAIGA